LFIRPIGAAARLLLGLVLSAALLTFPRLLLRSLRGQTGRRLVPAFASGGCRMPSFAAQTRLMETRREFRQIAAEITGQLRVRRSHCEMDLSAPLHPPHCDALFTIELQSDVANGAARQSRFRRGLNRLPRAYGFAGGARRR
jgi:hypothetical protein